MYKTRFQIDCSRENLLCFLWMGLIFLCSIANMSMNAIDGFKFHNKHEDCYVTTTATVRCVPDVNFTFTSENDCQFAAGGSLTVKSFVTGADFGGQRMVVLSTQADGSTPSTSLSPSIQTATVHITATGNSFTLFPF
jgi:hypothetical protein